MAKKETVKLTPEGLQLTTVLHYSSIAEMNGFYGKEVFFTTGFKGDKSYLYQALGNFGAFARDYDYDKDISLVIISNAIIDSYRNEIVHPFISDLEEKLNLNSSPYRRMKFISEDQLIWYIENRISLTKDKLTDSLIRKYKESKKEIRMDSLF
ncbi:hypothetical protein [Dysgonomonas termitidis]|uniref:Uncharacterized protein n=1 Tax=Dysgonomonas termitidis TaxID=1516126 RepID=A0ABV9KVQ6_9BACT